MILDYAPDKLLAESKDVVVSSDAWIIDRAAQWFNLAGYIIETSITEANVVSST